MIYLLKIGHQDILLTFRKPLFCRPGELGMSLLHEKAINILQSHSVWKHCLSFPGYMHSRFLFSYVAIDITYYLILPQYIYGWANKCLLWQVLPQSLHTILFKEKWVFLLVELLLSFPFILIVLVRKILLSWVSLINCKFYGNEQSRKPIP